MGNWKKPIAERGPKASKATMQAQAMAIIGTLC
jgi:hypothetical protein